MTDNQGMPCHSDGYHKEKAFLSFTTKDLHHSTGHGKDADPLALRTLKRNDSWNTPELEHAAVVDDCSKDNETKTRVLPMKKNQNDLFYHASDCKEDADALTSDMKDRDKFWNAPEHEYSMTVNDFVNLSKHETRASGSPLITSSELFQSDTNLYTDKNIIEPEHPESIACYKEINYHVVKDICVDEGMPVEEKGLIDRSSPGDLTQTGETRSDARNKIQNAVSEGESIVTTMLPLQEFGTRSFLRSFIASFDNGQDGISQQPNQSPSIEANLESFAAVSKADESNKNGPANRSNYNSKAANGNIIFDCNSPKPEAADRRGLSAETTEQSPKSDLVLNHNNGNSKIPLAANLVQQASMDGTTVDICQESMLNLKNRNSNNPFIVDEVESINMDKSTKNFDQETMINLKKVNSNNPFAFGEVQSVSMEQSSENIYLPSLNYKKGNFNPFGSSEVENAYMDRETENIHQPSMPNPENGKSINPFAVSDLQIASVDVYSESIHQPPVLNHEIGKPSNPFAVSEDQSYSRAEDIEVIHEQPELKEEDRDSSNPFAVSNVQGAGMDGITTNIHEEPLMLDNMVYHRDGTGKSLSASDHQSASSMAENNEVLHNKSFEPQDLPSHEVTSNTISINDRGQFGVGEASFSAAGPASGLITYSGPITNSGSTSLRSDSSATSTRSFAFPTLQSEWNSSPVRMRKADERHLRKHRGWKRRILCCKF